MRPEPLTRKQKKVLDTFERFSTERGYRPSVAELADELKLAKSTVHFHLMALARKGYLQHREHGRGVRMLEAPVGESARIPIIGAIAAGKPIEAQEDRREEIAVPRTLARGHALRHPAPERQRAVARQGVHEAHRRITLDAIDQHVGKRVDPGIVECVQPSQGPGRCHHRPRWIARARERQQEWSRQTPPSACNWISSASDRT